MAFKATFEVSGKKYDILSCSYAFSRNIDHKGRPSSDTSGGTVNLALESTEDTTLLESMLYTAEKPLTCSIDFQQNDDTASLKKLELKQAYIIQYSESFSDGAPMVFQITLSAKEISLKNAKLVNDWPAK